MTLPTPSDFRQRELPVVGRRVLRLGLAPNYGLDADGIREAFDSGMGYVFWTSRMRKVTPVLREAMKRDRERIVVATGPTTAFWAGNIRRYVHTALKALATDQLDVLQMMWLGVTSAWTAGTVDALVKLREEGKVRAIGISIHDRERAGRLAQDSPLDFLMVRYNAAHPGAERDIFPHLKPGRHAVVAYTATRWRKLLKRPRDWQGPVMTAPDCYRFCLSHPAVDVVLTGPKDRAQLRENLAALDKGPLSEEEMGWVRDFGRVVHG